MAFYTHTTGARTLHAGQLTQDPHDSGTSASREPLAPSARCDLPPCRPPPLTTILTSYDLIHQQQGQQTRVGPAPDSMRHDAITHPAAIVAAHLLAHAHTQSIYLSHVQVRVNIDIASPNLDLHHPRVLHHRTARSPWTEIRIDAAPQSSFPWPPPRPSALTRPPLHGTSLRERCSVLPR
jgi:hypothetical protein